MASEKILEVYDIEVLVNCFTYTGYDLKSRKWIQFVIHDSRNDLKELIEHLRRPNLWLIGFNNEKYDYPVIHHILNHADEYLSLGPNILTSYIYQKSQEIISMEFSAIADKNKFIPQIDLFRIWHYDNKARRTSLKALEVVMRMENIEEMPIHHSQMVSKEDIDLILKYNYNDVLATTKFFLITIGDTDHPLYKGKNKLKLRLDLKKKFNLNCLNYPDVKIGEQLILKLYSENTGISMWDLKNMRTLRNIIHLKDCIPSWANFESKEFNQLKEAFSNTSITKIKGAFDASVVYHGIRMEYGTGGVHSNCDPGVYCSDDYWQIVDEDIGSLYPSLAVQLGLYPDHLGGVFTNIYESIVNTRLTEKKKPKKERDMVIMEGYKLAANGIYGKSGEETSALYDPLYTMKTTIGGQMFLSLWTEKLVKAIPEIKFLQHNTDGITYMIPKSKLNLAKEVGDEMTRLTGLYIEDNFYKKVILRDVNNYIAQYENGEAKYKGCFEIDKEFHKDPSMRIVPIALSKFFLEDIPIEETIYNHRDIFDFCLMLKLTSKFKGEARGMNEVINLDRTTRYYISKKGYGLVKIDPSIKERAPLMRAKAKNYKQLVQAEHTGETGVNVGFVATLFNKFEEKSWEEYNINYQFYILECRKIINAVINKQLSLFDLW